MPISKNSHRKKQTRPRSKSKRSVLSYSPEVRRVLRVVKENQLPEASRRFIDTLKGFRDKPFILNSLNTLNSPYRDTQKRVRIRTFQILTVLITYMDWASFRIGIPKDVNDPVKHLAMRKRFSKIYGEDIPESTWFRYIEKLTLAGYLDSALMNLKNDDGKIRGTAGLKWLTVKLMRELGLNSGWIDEQRRLALERLKKAGLSNLWPSYQSQLARDKRGEALRREGFQTGANPGQYDTDPPPDFSDPFYH